MEDFHALTFPLRFPSTPATRLPYAVAWVRLPSPAQGSPTGPVAQCPGGAGCAPGPAPAPGGGGGRINIEGGREGSRGLRLEELV